MREQQHDQWIDSQVGTEHCDDSFSKAAKSLKRRKFVEEQELRIALFLEKHRKRRDDEIDALPFDSDACATFGD
jgi:hypothetical protein